MATIKTYSRSVTDRPGPAVPVQAEQTAMGSLADGIGQVGTMFQNIQDEIDVADAKTADASLSTLIREQLYGEGTGFMYSQGGDSVSRRDSVSEALKEGQRSLLDGLRPAARAKAESAMKARLERAYQNIDQHSTTQGMQYVDSASDARIISATNDAIFDPDKVSQSLAISRQEILDKADRNGWAPEKTQLELLQASTAIHSGIISRVATVDPVAAMGYLRDNRDSMSGAEVARLEASLTPMIKERAGRSRGAAAARGTEIAAAGVSEAGAGYTVITLDNGKTVRREGTRAWRNNNPGNIEYGEFAKSQGAVGTDGRFAVFPTYQAGRDAKAALIFESSSYRDLSISDAISRYAPAFENDTGSYTDQVAAAAGVSSDATMSSLSPKQRTAVLDAMERVEGFAVGKEVGGTSRAPSGIEELLSIEDPIEREAAISEFNMIAGIRKRKDEASRQAAADAAFRILEAGGNVTDIPLEHRNSIGMESMSSLRSYQEKLAAGEVQTEDSFYVQLSDDMARDPQKFMTMDPMQWRDRLNNADFDYFVKQRADLISGARRAGSDSLPVTTLRTAASTALKAAGLDDDNEAKASFESELLRWSHSFAADNGKNPSPMEVNQRINEMLVPIVLDPYWLWMWDAQSGRAFQMDYDGDPMNPNDDVTPQSIRDGALSINDKPVSNDVIETYALAFEQRFKRAPSVQELVEGLIATGNFE